MMKKQYIQPAVKTQAIATENILDGSKGLSKNDEKPTVDDKSNNYAKHYNIWE